MATRTTTTTGEGLLDIPLFRSATWQMAIGQRAALEGLLCQLRPTLAIEVGTAEGGSLARIAAHSREVHSFDLRPRVGEGDWGNVTFHVGDSHVLLPELLRSLEREGRTVDFALVDGDHSYEGVKVDIEHLLRSDAVRETVIVLHDTMNEDVRAGIESIPFEAFAKVAFTDLNFVLGYHDAGPLDEVWGGLGLVVVDAARTNFRIFDESIIVRDRRWERSAREALAWRAAAPLRRARRRAKALGRRLRERVRA